MLNAFRRSGSAAAQHAVLLAVNVVVGATVAGLVALTLMEHFEDTPEIRSLSCAVGLPRTDCPKYGENLKRLESEIAGLQSEKGQIEERLAALSAIENAVDQITLFETKTDPRNGFGITIGTVYRNFTAANPQPEHYFCYVNLANGAAGESRNLYFQGLSGPIAVSGASLNRAGLDGGVLAFGQSVCKPFLIGQKS